MRYLAIIDTLPLDQSSWRVVSCRRLRPAKNLSEEHPTTWGNIRRSERIQFMVMVADEEVVSGAIKPKYIIPFREEGIIQNGCVDVNDAIRNQVDYDLRDSYSSKKFPKHYQSYVIDSEQIPQSKSVVLMRNGEVGVEFLRRICKSMLREEAIDSILK